MKKRVFLAVMLLALCLALAACGCEHQYEEKITTEASCTAVGVKTFTCTLCEESYTEEIPMKEHTFGENYTSKESTCTEEGDLSADCTVCKFSQVVEKIPVIEHTYAEVVTKEPTCAEEGVITPTCACGATGEAKAVAKLEHNYADKVVKEATYKTAGEKEYTCSNCGDKYTKAISKLSTSKIVSNATKGSKYVTEALKYMKEALNDYKNYKDSQGRDATALMLLKTGFAKNCFEDAKDNCKNSADIAEVKSLLDKIISKLKYVQKYSSITKDNYYSIVMDIYNQDIYQDVTNYQKQLIDALEAFE